MRAETSTPINEIIATRRSPRSLDVTANISDSDLLALLEAARWAPSAFNGQPWRYFVGRRGDETFEAIRSVLADFNQVWAANASSLILVAGKDTKADGAPHPAYLYDCGLSVAQLTFEAHDRGFIAHQMTGFDKSAAQFALSISEDLKPVVVIAIGKQDAPEKLPEGYAQREVAPRQRLALEEIVLKGLPR